MAIGVLAGHPRPRERMLDCGVRIILRLVRANAAEVQRQLAHGDSACASEGFRAVPFTPCVFADDLTN